MIRLLHILETVKWMMGQLNETHRLCLMTFDEKVQFITKDLVPMTEENKELILDNLKNVEAKGQTNISDVLTACIDVIERCQTTQEDRLTSIMLFTDGPVNAGLRGKDFSFIIKNIESRLYTDNNKTEIYAYNTTIHTFGIGDDHDSGLLYDIASASCGGMYHYIKNLKSMQEIVGQILNNILSPVARNIEVTLEGHDGCRLINLYTQFPIVEITKVKKYKIFFGSLSTGQERTILIKLSLRKLGKECLRQHLLTAQCHYTNVIIDVSTNDNTDHASTDQVSLCKDIYVQRPLRCSHKLPNSEIDYHISRYTTAAAIINAIREKYLPSTKDKLDDVIKCICESYSAKISYHDNTNPVDDLLNILQKLLEAITFSETSLIHRHIFYSYARMYFTEQFADLDILNSIEI